VRVQVRITCRTFQHSFSARFKRTVKLPYWLRLLPGLRPFFFLRVPKIHQCDTCSSFDRLRVRALNGFRLIATSRLRRSGKFADNLSELVQLVAICDDTPAVFPATISHVPILGRRTIAVVTFFSDSNFADLQLLWINRCAACFPGFREIFSDRKYCSAGASDATVCVSATSASKAAKSAPNRVRIVSICHCLDPYYITLLPVLLARIATTLWPFHPYHS